LPHNEDKGGGFEGGVRGKGPTPEEKRRGDCSRFDKDAESATETQLAADAATFLEVVSAGDNTVAGIAVFVPGGQGIAMFAKTISFGSQSIQAAANYYVGAKTGNFSAFNGQMAGLGTGLIVGQAAGRLARASGVPGRMGAIARDRKTGAFGGAVGDVVGDSTSDVYCGR
jgi:hypothetical protein